MSTEEQRKKYLEIMSILKGLKVSDIKILLTDISETIDEFSILEFCIE